MITKKFKISNMHCNACAMTLESIEDNLKGIYRASASYAKQNLEIQYEPALVNEKQIVAAVNKLGYTIQEIL